MRTQASQTKKNTLSLGRQQSRSIVNGIAQRQRQEDSTFQFVDKRTKAVAQRKLQESVNDSAHVKQLSAFQEMAITYSKQKPLIQKKENKTDLPDNLKSGMENLSGLRLDHVKVHRNSYKPAAVQAHAFAQGSEIHLGPGQEKHLAHELGHVVQQAQGRVKPTTSINGMAVNDNVGLEKEADAMGAKALRN